MIIGVGLDQRLGFALSGYEDLATEAQILGFESLWTNSMSIPDAFHVCSAWSSKTAARTGTPLRTGIAVIPAPRDWKLESLVNQASTVGQIAKGHFVLGIGTGGAGPRYWESVGLPPRPIAVMRDYARVLRALFSGEEVTYQGPAISVSGAKLAQPIPGVPVYLAALGPQMLKLAGEVADGVCLNWASTEQIAWSNEIIASAAQGAGRNRSDVTVSMYVRVCIDDDVRAARRAFGIQALNYSLARPGVDPTLSYRGHFGRMGFQDLLADLEKRRADGARVSDLVDRVPDEFFNKIGYFGPAGPAAERFAALADGLDEAIVRVITARPGLEPAVEAMEALTPAKIRAAQG